MYCNLCSELDGPAHISSEKHKKNVILEAYWNNRSNFGGNRQGIIVTCNVKSSLESIADCTKSEVKISVTPNEKVTFHFTISNDTKKEVIHVQSIYVLHTKYDFVINSHGLNTRNGKKLLPKSRLQQDINVTFSSADIGQYETPIVFTFVKPDTNKKINIMKDMVVYVEKSRSEHLKIMSPYANEDIRAKELRRSPAGSSDEGLFRIPKNNKSIYLQDMKIPENCDELKKILIEDIRNVFAIGVTKENYEKFFHHLLWYEETMIRKNLQKYNMSGVYLSKIGQFYTLRVPGLAEKRPSLLVGDTLFVRPYKNEEVWFEAIITEINEDRAIIGKFHQTFPQYYSSDAKFDIRFFMSRVSLERMHVAVHNIIELGLEPRVFPKQQKITKYKAPKLQFYNPLVGENPEQRIAVEHIVSGTSGRAPYLVHGPPGTGKTITIVEAILQIVKKNQKNRILVCTDSNMAADHVATMLIKYASYFAQEKFLLRASSMYRQWESLPESLKDYSNGTSRDSFEPVSIEEFMSHNIVVTTLSHAAKFGRQLTSKKKQRPISHLFIDEAAQASEPSCLIPMSGLLAPGGQLVLAGDPHQLGPVIISHKANETGLGRSLMERLMKSDMFPMYNVNSSDSNYVVMLRNNFRSDAEIIDIPDKLFYQGQLRTYAKKDSLSEVDILGEKPRSHATVFHSVMSKEGRMGKSPRSNRQSDMKQVCFTAEETAAHVALQCQGLVSYLVKHLPDASTVQEAHNKVHVLLSFLKELGCYFNNMECDLVKLYVLALVTKHKVQLSDIGIVTPYLRQVYKIKKMLGDLRYDKIEVGTVESFQGKEKRIIIISTVRANCNLLDYDARFQLGFLVDDKRFNVALTRAKAKVIIIGNPLCLEKDLKWKMYIDKCRDLGTYHGFDSENVQYYETSKDASTKLASMLTELQIEDESLKKNRDQAI